MKKLLIIVPLAFTVFAIVSSGCIDNRENCARLGRSGEWPCDPIIDDTGNGGGGNGGEGGGTPTECIPSEAGEAGVGEECGVFVSSSTGDDGAADGSKAKPYATIGVALSGGPKAVYLCGETFSEAVALPAGVSLYGALNCAAAWAYEPTMRTSLAGPADTVALTVSGAGTSAVEDVDVTAASATVAGGSSIVVLVDGVAVDFARCDFVAGDGMAGADGDTPTDGDLAGEPGMDGTDEDMNMMACPPMGLLGPNGGQKTCGAEDVSGGNGGNGQTVATGGDGGTGGPMGTGGDAGSGEGVMSAQCAAGGQGEVGPPGTPGAGATGLGMLSGTGYLGSVGEDGMTSGGPGKGGGGGGGANMCAATGAGPSGGGGGSGGCGGQAGKGGHAGGSSIALASIDSAVSLNDCKLTSGSGATGGSGSPAQEGGDGGPPGVAGGGGACGGGQGGKGGRGGAAGGGLGGHSFAIAHVGNAPVSDGGSTLTPGAAGTGGPGGDGGVMENQGGAGDDGKTADVQSFEAE